MRLDWTIQINQCMWDETSLTWPHTTCSTRAHPLFQHIMLCKVWWDLSLLLLCIVFCLTMTSLNQSYKRVMSPNALFRSIIWLHMMFVNNTRHVFCHMTIALLQVVQQWHHWTLCNGMVALASWSNLVLHSTNTWSFALLVEDWPGNGDLDLDVSLMQQQTVRKMSLESWDNGAWQSSHDFSCKNVILNHITEDKAMVRCGSVTMVKLNFINHVGFCISTTKDLIASVTQMESGIYCSVGAWLWNGTHHAWGSECTTHFCSSAHCDWLIIGKCRGVGNTSFKARTRLICVWLKPDGRDARQCMPAWHCWLKCGC